MKTCDAPSPFYVLQLHRPPPLAAVHIGNSAGKLSKPMSNFANEHSLDYRGYPYDFSLPEDLYQEGNQMPEFDDSLIGKDSIWGRQGSSRLQAKFKGPKVSEDNYVRISQVWSTSAANVSKLPNDFDKDSVEGECIGKGDCSEGTLNEAKNFGSYFGRSLNSNSMEKDAAHIFENKIDFFSSAHNDPEEKLSEDFPDCIDSYVDNLAPSGQSERQKQVTQNMQQEISSLTAYVGRLEIQVEHLTRQVQDMADKLSGENKLSALILDHFGDSKAALEEYEIISSAGEASGSKLFMQSEDPSQPPDETGDSDISISDWEII